MPKVNKLERQTLRVIQDHMLSLCRQAGARQEHISTIDVLVHPDNPAPDMNLVIPSPGVAWPRGSDLEAGIEILSEYGREPRLQYLSGLFPDAFGKRLTMQGFQPERARTIWLYTPVEGPFPEREQPYGRVPNHVPPEFHVEEVNTRRVLAIWLRVYRSAAFDVDVPEIDDDVLETLQAERKRGDSIFVLGYYLQTPIAAAWMSLGLDVAQIVDPVMIADWCDLGYEELLLGFAVRQLQRRQKQTIYMVSDTARSRLLRRVGFVRVSEIITYSKS